MGAMSDSLTPDMHWAMDRHLIAPGPEPRLYPKREALAWRVGRLGSPAG